MRFILRNTKLVFETKNVPMPTHYDYEILGFYGALDEINNAPSNYYFFNHTATWALRHIVNGSIADTPTLSNGSVLKLSDNLFAVYNGETFDYITKNSYEQIVSFEDGRYNFTSPTTFEKVDISGVKCASVNVKAGDVIIYESHGSNSSDARIMAIKNGSSCEFVASDGTITKHPSVYLVKEDGVLYFNAAIISPYSLKVLRK